ncbi:MAG TPA: MoaD/ThiS family protein [Nocardioidaceae bacterium]|jgi:molybdopterin converting factor small subunit|nr:MoaD/ThiS family protein [Nocardioidaceae bacterium]
MSGVPSDEPTGDQASRGADTGRVTVRYWAGARAAAGVPTDTLEVSGPVSVAEVVERVRALHTDSPRFADVVAVCSVLIGEKPLGGADPAQVQVAPGEVVELLPPFAGG